MSVDVGNPPIASSVNDIWWVILRYCKRAIVGIVVLRRCGRGPGFVDGGCCQCLILGVKERQWYHCQSRCRFANRRARTAMDLHETFCARVQVVEGDVDR